MPRVGGQKEYVSLIKGLVTEASPLTFPEGSTSGELNFVVNKEGLLRERRRGFDFVYETNSTFAGAGSTLENLFYWRGSGYVIAIITNNTPETYVRIHEMGNTFDDFADVKIADSVVSTQIAALTNYLVITLSNGQKPILLDYKEADNTISVNEVDLYLRDFELVDDGLSASQHPVGLTDNHKYNLYNSGWYVDKKDETTAGNPLDSVIDVYFTNFSEYPSNADSVAVGMITNASGELTFSPEYVRDAGLGNSLAPRGHFVYTINSFDRDVRNAAPTLDGSPSTTLTELSSIDNSGNPTYNPDDPTDPQDPPWFIYEPPSGGIIDF
ncbi:MAG: hypothetical protein Unbinned96contig1001_38 [Prokaryotic dsDNA virus sp.]|nr:MAG: hypothetical protein Unbinned96contig1001_38 [Prokaryotic dsDNA virus sp.]|tara:strand:- start:26743 stop:27720 length:978 start_codon:yes stop_codon:yes gene_type:complete